jgi:hypothetical protein
MPYLLRVQVIGQAPELAISEADFAAYRDAHAVLFAGLAIEEKFEIFASNYLEFEKEILAQVAECMVRYPDGYEDIFETRMALNRQLINLLTTARLYEDHVKHHAKEIIGAERGPEINALFSTEYDAAFEYRFMEALRNFVQHRGFPAHGIKQGGVWLNDHHDLVFSMELTALKTRLADGNAFKAAVLAESPERVDLVLACRAYVGAMSRINRQLREMVSARLGRARELVQAAVDRYEPEYGRKALGLAAVKLSEGGGPEEVVPLLLNWDNIRLRLAKRNGEFVNLKKRSVSSACKPLA